MSNGTSGDINNIDFLHAAVSQPPYAQIRKVADLVAQAVRDGAVDRVSDVGAVGDARARLRLARHATPKDEVARAKYVLSQAKGPVLSSAEEVYARDVSCSTRRRR